jgi:hypothetical protein
MPSTNSAAIAARVCADRRYRRAQITEKAANALRASISSILGSPELARRAHVRPAATTNYPMPR